MVDHVNTLENIVYKKTCMLSRLKLREKTGNVDNVLYFPFLS